MKPPQDWVNKDIELLNSEMLFTISQRAVTPEGHNSTVEGFNLLLLLLLLPVQSSMSISHCGAHASGCCRTIKIRQRIQNPDGGRKEGELVCVSSGKRNEEA